MCRGVNFAGRLWVKHFGSAPKPRDHYSVVARVLESNATNHCFAEDLMVNRNPLRVGLR